MKNTNTSIDLDALAVKIAEKLAESGTKKAATGGNSEWLNIKDAAAYLRVSVSHLRKSLYAGKINATRSGKIIIFSKRDLDNFILNR